MNLQTLFKASINGVVATISLAIASVSVTWGCDVCIRLPGIPFEADHPAAIEVAMAAREAADRGDLDLSGPVNAALSANRYAGIRLNKVSPERLIRMWLQTNPARELEARMTIDVVFVDTEQTCHLDIRAGNVLLGVPRTGPADIQVFTTRAGFQSLFLEGLDHCEERMLVKLELAEQPLRNEFSRLFARARNQFLAQAAERI